MSTPKSHAMSHPVIYLDNNATTRTAPEVRDAMLPYFSDLYGNASSMHAFGGQIGRPLREAREQLAALLGAEPDELVFTSCGSESDNQAIFGAVDALGPETHIITSTVEHPAVLEPCRLLLRRGHRVSFIGVDEAGRLKLDDLAEALEGAGPKLVSLMWANNETGVLFPINRIAEMVHAANGLLHTDAVQAVGKLAELDMRRVPVDLLSLSGHKLHAPKGVGALFIRKGLRIKPYLHGGHQERGRRAGTENVPYIIGLGKAAELARSSLDEERGRVAALRDRLEAGLLATCADARVNGDRDQRLPNTSNISFEFIEGEAILYHLSDHGICASSGSACTSGSLDPSHVIRAMGVPFTAAHGSIRFSLSRYTTDAEVDHALEVVPRVVERLRAMSPFAKT